MTTHVRVISYAWGSKYVDDFLSLTLPALLAPGNLPELARRFDLELVFLTEEQQFARVEAALSWQRAAALCRARLIALDDLIVGHWYGISLSKALVRGFLDLGERVLDTYLVFLNADFIVADGSYRTIADKIEAGERLMFAPSYCVVRETVLPALTSRVRDATLAIGPRDMAEIGIPNRHYTIRAKTANQRLFRIHRYDQFYWYVDAHTLLARQMPISLVCMRPEKVLTDIHTFWDYGIVTEACPTLPHCVLGDSDAYQMIELRDERTFEGLMGLGWPTLDEIGADLSSFTTQDQRDHLRHELIWHSRDLPPTLGAARAAFQRFIDAVAARLSPQAVSHLNHQFWTAAIGRWEAMRAEYLARRHAPAALAETPNPATAAAASPAAASAAAASPAAAAPRRGRLRELGSRVFGSVPAVKPPHPYWADLRHAMEALAAVAPIERSRVLVVSNGAGLFERAALRAAAHRRLTPGYLLERSERRIRIEGDLIVSAERPDGTRQEVAATRVTVTDRGGPARSAAEPAPEDGELYDLCLCELDWDELRRFRDIFDQLRPRLRQGARIIVLHLDRSFRRRWREEGGIIRTSFPLEGRSEVLFSGTAGSRLARRIFARAFDRTGAARKPILALAAAAAAVTSWASAASVRRQDPYQPSPHATSLTMVIDLV